MKLFGELYWLKGRASNAFLYPDIDGWVLVDAGMGGQIDPVAWLAARGEPASALRHIVITHADVDHVGRLAALQRATGARVYAGAQTAALLQAGRFPRHNAWPVDRFTGWLFHVEPLPAAAIGAVEDGATLPLLGGLHALATPGHTVDHMAFDSPATGVLFAGDALNTFGNRLQVSSRFISADYAQARRSALRLAARAPALFACGHGRPFVHRQTDLSALTAALR